MNFLNMLEKYPPYRRISENLNNTPISVAGVTESAQSQLIYSLAENGKKSALVLVYSDMEAKALYSDLSFYTDNAAWFPSKEYVFYNIETSGHENEKKRLAVLDKLLDGNCIVVASVDAVLQYTADKAVLENSRIEVEIGKRFELDKLADKLVTMGYVREDMVEGEGQFSIRGGILDVFTPNMDMPVRIEFFDDETDSIRLFDAYSQRSSDKLEIVNIIPVTEAVMSYEKKDGIVSELKKRISNEKKTKAPSEYYISTLSADIESLNERHYFPSIDKYASMIYGKIPTIADYFSEDSFVFVVDPKRIAERGKSFEWEKGELITELKQKEVIGKRTKESFFAHYDDFIAQITQKKVIAIDALSHTKTDFNYKYLEMFTTKTTISFHGKIDYLYDDLEKWQKDGYTSIILVSTHGRGENLSGVLNERGIKTKIVPDGGEITEGRTNIVRGSLGKGFEYPEIRTVVISDSEIFEQKRRRNKRNIDNANRIKSYNDINENDYVVHAVHGIGRYLGTHKMVVGGITKDYLKIQYQGTDILYVPIDQLNMLYKYVGGDTDRKMKLNKLGGADWNKTKQRVKKATDDLAKDLIKLYAERAGAKGYAFSADTPWQREFEDTFPYRETDDQLRSVEEIKKDMESTKPMDRLLCGDVGFGKTEIAIRAAFKAVCDSKQVAYLCPTTVLAMQHYETFLKRMENFPIKVEMLSRFRSAAQQKKIIKKLKTGEIDIIIGTHRILSKDLEFHDLGLLVVDEEQRFGVAHKERLKEIKKNVDVLTMTATPIPRTLHMAMTSIRDMSVLTEPPENRYPVQTYVLEDNPEVVLNAVRNELSRGGQVFYLYNKVQGIYRKAEWLKSQFPNAEVAVGHGKMHEDELEGIMYDMVNGDIDILVCTTIIETGLDIPNANTIIIENADRMGLAQLYQLRGRVGRSNRTAYAYLTYRRDSILSDVASKRLRAAKEFTEFGSGFKIAMRDLEIRGAGNILGAEQHGHMESVGYDMYCKILQESIDEAKGTEKKRDTGVSIDININAYLPESYIENDNQRIDIYKKIAAIENESDKFEIEDELIDRYGDIPKFVQNIIDVSALKIKARECGIYEISQHGNGIELKFNEDCIDAKTIFALDTKYPKRIKISASEKPAITFRTDEGTNPLQYLNELLPVICEMQKNTVDNAK